MARFPDGSRKLISIAEMVKAKDYETKEILTFDESKNGLRFIGNIPAFCDRLKKESGYSLKDI
jgi:hypothetical protein